MNQPVHLRAHKLSASASLCAAGFNQLAADSPAIEAMTDFSRVAAVSIAPEALIDDANARMISRGVRLLMVLGKDDEVVGLITARDILGEKPLQVALARASKRDELRVGELMTPIGSIDTLALADVLRASVGEILDALKQLGRQHILVEDNDPLTGLPRVRGLFSATQIGRALGVPVLGFDLPRTFAEIEAALVN
ncbi:CBS domain-containing protein [Azonexus caeni]|jgi:CBS domain-containing protein|uniref:CBS domain-containing protein n=1 Tax=Azonexus caeni TaxID=266126 RepID=UPI002CE67278|nr:CBS domain-containing protein [Azonexus sp.]